MHPLNSSKCSLNDTEFSASSFVTESLTGCKQFGHLALFFILSLSTFAHHKNYKGTRGLCQDQLASAKRNLSSQCKVGRRFSPLAHLLVICQYRFRESLGDVKCSGLTGYRLLFFNPTFTELHQDQGLVYLEPCVV